MGLAQYNRHHHKRVARRVLHQKQSSKSNKSLKIESVDATFEDGKIVSDARLSGEDERDPRALERLFTRASERCWSLNRMSTSLHVKYMGATANYRVPMYLYICMYTYLRCMGATGNYRVCA